jgi:hypothetical protein
LGLAELRLSSTNKNEAFFERCKTFYRLNGEKGMFFINYLVAGTDVRTTML